MAQWLRVHADLSSTIGKASIKEIVVNFNTVKKVSPRESDSHGTKITFIEGETMMLAESLEYLFAALNDTLEGGYVALDPKLETAV